MRNNYLLVLLILLGGCEHFGIIFKPPSTIKAVIEGRIKGVEVYCEKVINLGQPKWELMCKVSDDIDIKYRTKTINGEQTRLELVVDKIKAGKRKIITAPMVIVKRGKPTKLRTVASSFDLDIKTEAMR